MRRIDFLLQNGLQINGGKGDDTNSRRGISEVGDRKRFRRGWCRPEILNQLGNYDE